MRDEIDSWLQNPYVETLAFFMVTIMALIVFLAVFEFVTRYSNWQEIKKGNVAVAMATGGKIFGIGNIFRFSIQANDTVYHSLIWASYGFVLLLAAYFIFEFLTPNVNIDNEIAKDNRAIGFISMVISISLSYVIGASVL
jgi:putative membrane protein